jgi:hypothetical protein
MVIALAHLAIISTLKSKGPQIIPTSHKNIKKVFHSTAKYTKMVIKGGGYKLNMPPLSTIVFLKPSFICFLGPGSIPRGVPA